MPEASLSCLPPQLRLPVAVTCYWWTQAKPPPDKKVLRALLLAMNAGDALRCRAGTRQVEDDTGGGGGAMLGCEPQCEHIT